MQAFDTKLKKKLKASLLSPAQPVVFISLKQRSQIFNGESYMQARYEKNITALSEEETITLSEKHVCVIGCGGLGGTVVELLARLGIGHITVVDPDVFSESNLNRQLFSTESNIGSFKAEEALKRVREINSGLKLMAVTVPLNEGNAKDILKGCHVVVDALDSIHSRIVLQRACRELSLPLVHGAIGGWFGQVSTILPGDSGLDELYGKTEDKNAESGLGNLSFIAAATASFQCAEVVKLLTGRGELLSKSMLCLNFLSNTYEIISIS
jgi:molybdopterin/thiamine biosynthesis adenylyltransferase